MIEKLDMTHELEHARYANKINEIIDMLTEEEPRILICPHCGSDEWESGCASTLMGGPMNYYTYTCFKCGKPVRVLRIKGERDPRIYLGPKDEIVK